MQCKDCEMWGKRETPASIASKSKRKEFYPTGRCFNPEFRRDVFAVLCTSPDTNCSRGTPDVRTT